MNVKVPVKIIAIVVVYISQPNFKFGFKLRNSRLPLFYLLIIPIAIAAFIINKDYKAPHYTFLFMLGLGCWLLAILAVHQTKLMVEKARAEAIYHTLVAFFIINAIASAGNLAIIMWQTGSLNPYTFRGLNQTYFISTGDDVKGITFDISSTNAVLCAFGVFYFLFRKNLTMLMVCACTMFLTYSNLISLLFLFILALIFILKSTRDQKSTIIICFTLYAFFMVKVSPENKRYMDGVIENTFHHKSSDDRVARSPITGTPDSILTPEGKRRAFAQHYLDSVSARIVKKKLPGSELLQAVPLNGQGRVYIPPPNLNAPEFYIKSDTTPDRRQLLDFISLHSAGLSISTQKNYEPVLPGKVTGAIQTINFLKTHPQNILMGAGVGNFSAKIAFRAAGAGIRGDYPKNYLYISPLFLANHLDLYLSFFSREVGFRSVRNNPYSVYDQLLSEYGVFGLLAFLIYYLWFFSKHYRTLTYGLPILLFTLCILFIDYWFEQLSVMVLFELMLFLNIKETTITYAS